LALAAGGRRSEAALAFRGLSLTRRVLDEALLERAARAGARLRRGVRATALAREGDGWSVATAGEELRAETVLLATASTTCAAGGARLGARTTSWASRAIGVSRGPEALAGLVELHLFPGGYAGLQPVEGGRANLCLVVRRAAFSALGGWDVLLAHLLAASPSLAGRMAGAVPCDGRPLAIAAIPYGLVADRSEGIWRLGDQAAVIPSFTGEGMSLALHGARAAAEAILAGRAPAEFQASLARDLRGQVRRSACLSRALVMPAGQAIASRMAGPRTMGWVLRATRIPARARGRLHRSSTDASSA
jgi:flavin-dependent dehydrogenase